MSPKSASSTAARFVRGEKIDYTTARSAFGWIIVGATTRGLCWLSLASSKKEAVATLREEFSLADLHEDPALTIWIERSVEFVTCGAESVQRQSPAQRREKSTTQWVDLRGTEFQQRVWLALQKIPRGQTRCYSELARALGKPNAVRAVAHACAMNRVALLVPCHRVIGATGALTGYRWGIERKRQLLEAEGARLSM
jgi:AraC family transcriptional regulator of adaptative response/methylated-DNA-[protein]-cysteine methyltransferase